MYLKELSKRIDEINTANGWKDEEVSELVQLALIHTEVSEGVEEVRKPDYEPTRIYYEPGKSKPEGLPIELADTIIRCLDMATCHNIDIENAINLKLAYNAQRGYRHGGKRV